MAEVTLQELLAEFATAVIGPRWLEVIRDVAAGLTHRYDPTVYAVAEPTWSPSEIEDLVQDVTLERLLGQRQLHYIIDVAASIEDVRRLLNHQTRRALAGRRRRTVVDRLLTRIRTELEGNSFEALSGGEPERWRPAGSAWDRDQPGDAALRRAASAIRIFPKSDSESDRAPAVFRSAVLRAVIDTSFEVCESSLSIADFGRILDWALTSWLPVVLEEGNEPEAAIGDLVEMPLELEETVTLVLDRLDTTDRLVLRVKLSGASDSELATQLGVSRPTAAARKVQAFDRLRSAWAEIADDASGTLTQRLAEEIYFRLTTESEAGR